MTKTVNFHDLAKLSPAERNRLLQRTEADLSAYEDKVRAITARARAEGIAEARKAREEVQAKAAAETKDGE